MEALELFRGRFVVKGIVVIRLGCPYQNLHRDGEQLIPTLPEEPALRPPDRTPSLRSRANLQKVLGFPVSVQPLGED